MIENKINHVTFVLDRSYSMSGKERSVIQVTDSLIEYLAKRSKEVDQETRVTVYIFDDRNECIIYDKDVLRMPSISEFYVPRGNTALIDATSQALIEATDIPERYGDHSFLFYVVTDGEENSSIKNRPADLKKWISTAPDNFTIACLVPDHTSVAEAKSFGFPADNIQIWDTKKSFDEVGKTLRQTTERYFQARAQGIRGTKSLFKLDTSKLAPSNVKRTLEHLSKSEYHIFPVYRDSAVSDFVKKKTRRNYVKGSAYYELMKKEIVQPYKQICLLDKNDGGSVYTGDNARKMLGLPDYEVKVDPTQTKNFTIFVQSTSLNRKLVGGTDVIVLK